MLTCTLGRLQGEGTKVLSYDVRPWHCGQCQVVNWDTLATLVWAQESAQRFGCVLGILWCLGALEFSPCTPIT